MKILVVRRDNIGDLICTTPLFQALREKFPDAYLGALVNSYNRPAIEGNPYVDEVFAFTKAKHLEAGDTALAAHWRRLKLFWKLRSLKFDYIILANLDPSKALSLTFFLAPKNLIAYETPSFWRFLITHPVSRVGREGKHEVENMFNLLQPLGIAGDNIPPMTVVPDAAVVAQIEQALPPKQAKRIAVHISARKEKQRWPVEKFAELIKSIHREQGCEFLLFWSPGDENNPFNPGDDQKAERLLQLTQGVPVFPVKTTKLQELIAGLSLADMVICSDGGGMHVAAALRKPIVCFFGNSDARIWYPWGVQYELLQAPSKLVEDIGVIEVGQALNHLFGSGCAIPIAQN